MNIVTKYFLFKTKDNVKLSQHVTNTGSKAELDTRGCIFFAHNINAVAAGQKKVKQ